MKRIFLTGLAAVCFAVMSLSALEASVPKVMTFQGLLKDLAGAYLSGTYPMTFRIYSAETGGSALWTEPQADVTVSSGRFSVEIGSVNTMDLDFSQDYWLSVQVGTDSEMTPRERLTSAGYAFMAESVVNGFTQAQHDALSHRNIEGVKANAANIAKTNFKLDAYTMASANSMGDMIIDTLNDAAGIHAASSGNYAWRGSPNYDVVVQTSSGGVIQQSTEENDFWEFLSNQGSTYNGVGQQFKHTAAVTVDRAAFKWARLGNPAGNIRIRLYSDFGGLPGNLLGETGNIPVNGIQTLYPNWEEYTATFNSPVTIAANTPYHVVIENIDGSGDGSNHVNVRRAGGGNPYAEGTPVSKNSSGGWQVASGDAYDTYFKVYEQPAPAGEADVRSIAFAESAVPKEAMVIADETLNTGSIAYSISRDNGVTWTSCPKETVVNISSQPPGTQVRWKAVISGDAQLKAMAVAL